MSYFIIMFILLMFLYAYYKRTGSFPFTTGDKNFDAGMNIMFCLFWAVTIPMTILIFGGIGIIYLTAIIYYAIKDKIQGVRYDD